jgi:hypothetical protein
MSNALAESCRLQSASLLTIFRTRIVPVGAPASENSAIVTSPTGPLGNVVDNGRGTERRDQTAIPTAAAPPLSRKARRVIRCRATSSFRSESNIALRLTTAQGVTAGRLRTWELFNRRRRVPQVSLLRPGILLVEAYRALCLRIYAFHEGRISRQQRYQRGPRQRHPDPYASNCLLTNSFSNAGFACPFDKRITWPTKNAATVFLPPRYCSTCLGFEAMTS